MIRFKKPIIGLIGPLSLEEVKSVGVRGSSVDLDDEVCESAGAVHHPETSLVVSLGYVGIVEGFSWSHSYVVAELEKNMVFSRE